MTTPLLHMTTGPGWRAALATGELRAESLDTQGFLHLSTPEQVPLPANRLYVGRTDLVLLCVDPARVGAEVRWEPGVSGDPESMRFPHLYGPLPTSAVQAVLRYVPDGDGVFGAPVDLPAVDDTTARARALHRGFPRRRARHVVDVHGGVAVLDPRHPLSHEHNRLLLDRAGDASTVVASTVVGEAERVLGGVGLAHRAALVEDEAVTAALGARGWAVQPLALMASSLHGVRVAGRAQVVAQQRVHALWLDGWRRAGLDEQTAAALVAREASADEVVRVLDVAVLVDGVPVSSAQLRVDGATAAMESVLTHPDHRGQGHAADAVAHALAQAGGLGVDLVVLEAAADDWPQRWYGRLGFTEVGRFWECTRG